MSHVDGVDDGVGYGVFGRSNIGGSGVVGLGSGFGSGLYGFSGSGDGVFGQSDSSSGIGVYGRNTSHNGGNAVLGESYNGRGVVGNSMFSNGVEGNSLGGSGVIGYSSIGPGVRGVSLMSDGVSGYSAERVGVAGRTDTGYGLYGRGIGGYAAYLDGKVRVTGYLYKDGGGFEIDHPLDPANKYLHHSFVESPDMKNVYDGVVALDDKGEAVIELPDWFDALNKDFRYQLTAIRAPGPNLYIAEEISDGVTNYSNSSSNNNKSHFKVAGGTSGMKVSWQVTGIRKDPFAKAHPIQVEEDKPDKERGYYIYPDLYGQSAEKGISRLLFPPEEEKQELLINDQNRRPKRKIPS
jgi:hypothetical protein